MCSLPLYQGVEDITRTRPQQGNAGLYFDKFFNKWRSQGDSWTLDNEKLEWLRTFSTGEIGDAELLHNYVQRFGDLVTAQRGQLLFLINRERFVTGMGRNHPVENGFAWHHSFGVPYLPASSVKGMTRAWAESWENALSEEINRIFGSDNPKQPAAGTVIFFDLVPLAAVTVEPDIMTPHYGEYYQDTTGQKPPADWYNPNPIPFLTVKRNQNFVTGLAPRTSGSEIHRQDVETACKWLTKAIEIIGAGAKTAIGYGRFQEDKDGQTRWEDQARQRREEQERQAAAAREEARLAALPPLERELIQDGWEKGTAFDNNFSKWLERMKTATGSERYDIAQYLAEWYQQNKPADWKKPGNDKNKKKVDPIKAVLQEVRS